MCLCVSMWTLCQWALAVGPDLFSFSIPVMKTAEIEALNDLRTAIKGEFAGLLTLVSCTLHPGRISGQAADVCEAVSVLVSALTKSLDRATVRIVLDSIRSFEQQSGSSKDTTENPLDTLTRELDRSFLKNSSVYVVLLLLLTKTSSMRADPSTLVSVLRCTSLLATLLLSGRQDGSWESQPARIVLKLHVAAMHSISMQALSNPSAAKRLALALRLSRASVEGLTAATLGSLFDKFVCSEYLSQGKFSICSGFLSSLVDRMISLDCFSESRRSELMKGFMALMSSRVPVPQSQLVFSHVINY